MKRLTYMHPDGYGVLKDCKDPGDAITKLAAIEDAEEQGRLVRLPCKVGDAAWAIRSFRGTRRVKLGLISEMHFLKKDMSLQIVVGGVGRGALGKKVFLARAEAEAALAAGNGSEEK